MRQAGSQRPSVTRRGLLRASAALVAASVPGLCGCARDSGSPREAPADDLAEAEKDPLAEQDAEQPPDAEFPPSGRLAVFDLHCDTSGRHEMADDEVWRSIIAEDLARGLDVQGDLRSNNGALDLERMHAFSYCQCFATWMPRDEPSEALSYYRSAMALLVSEAERNADLLEIARSTPDETAMGAVRRIISSGRVAGLLTVENSSMVGAGLDVIDEMAEDGVVMASLTWNGVNALASGKFSEQGLTELGREAVARFEEDGIVVDISHLNDASIDGVLQVARRPIVASHSNSRSVCGASRNLTDDQFRAIRDMGGLVGLNLFRDYLVERDAPAEGEVTFDEVSAHLEHFLSLGGEDVIALGTDYDSVDTPDWIMRCEQMPEFDSRLRQRFGDDIADKMLFQNAFDFFTRYEAGA